MNLIRSVILNSDFLIRTRQEAELLESGMALVEAASRRLDFEQSRDGSATGARQPDNVPIDFPTKSGNLNVKQQSCSPYESKRNAGESHTNALNAVALHPDDRASLIIRGGVKGHDS